MVLLKGFIYKIFSERFKDEIVYIGQTRQDLQVRWNKHKRDAREFEFEDKNELLNKLDERENFFINKFNSIDQG